MPSAPGWALISISRSAAAMAARRKKCLFSGQWLVDRTATDFLATDRWPLATSFNPPSANHHIAVIEHHGLAGRDGALRLVEGGDHLAIAASLDHRGSGLMTMPDL